MPVTRDPRPEQALRPGAALQRYAQALRGATALPAEQVVTYAVSTSQYAIDRFGIYSLTAACHQQVLADVFAR